MCTDCSLRKFQLTLLCLIVSFLYGNLFAQSKPNSTVPKKKGLLIQADDPEDMKRWAIVVGVNDYNDVGITDLSKARNDAKIMGQILTEQGEFEKVFVMTDDLDAKDSLYPNRINVEEKIDTVLSYANKGDMILFFFSGHGISDSTANGYVLPVDAVADKPLYSAISVNMIIEKLNKKGIKKSLLLLDACRDVMSSSKGASKEGLQADKFQNAEVGATFFSTKAGYYSFEDSKSDFGVFTKSLAYGMEGKADKNGDGIVSFGELEEFVQNEVNDWSLANNKQQKPFVRYYKEKYGDIPITVKGVREKSLVEKNSYNEGQSKLPFVWRSALLPGWGQWYAGSKVRGMSYSFAALGALGYFASSYSGMNSAQSAYNSAMIIPGNTNFFLLTYMNNQSKKSALESAQGTAQSAYFLVLGVWLWNLFDAGVITHKEKPKDSLSIDFNIHRYPVQVYSSNLIETHGSFEIFYKF